jgi:hypothetical protein
MNTMSIMTNGNSEITSQNRIKDVPDKAVQYTGYKMLTRLLLVTSR